MTGVEFILLMIGIGILAGIISAAAGLASLVTYPSLLAMGLPNQCLFDDCQWLQLTICLDQRAAGPSKAGKDRFAIGFGWIGAGCLAVVCLAWIMV